MKTKLKDYYENPLRDGIYFGGDGLDGDLYIIKLHKNGKTFSAKYWQFSSKIADYELFAKQLIPLANPRSNLEWALLNLSS